MLAFSSELLSWLAGRFRSRAELELEVIALRHQLAVLHRQRPGRPQLFALDRILWIWLYRVWPRCLNIMVLVKPATVVQWHRQGFRLYWRWRSRSGRPSVGREVRDLIRQMNSANPLWGAPRIPRQRVIGRRTIARDHGAAHVLLVEQSEYGAFDRAGQRVERADVVEAADERDRALAITMGFVDRATEAFELVGLAEQTSPVALLLEGLVRAHRSQIAPG